MAIMGGRWIPSRRELPHAASLPKFTKLEGLPRHDPPGARRFDRPDTGR
jgi:hypothetical protein